MKVVGNFNKISDKLKAEIPVLRPGEVKTFQCLHGVPNPDPDPTEKLKNPMLFGKRQLKTNFRIFDPYITDANGKEVGGYVDVGAVQTWNKDQPETFTCFIPGFGQHQNTGKFQLSASKVDEAELFEVLWLSPERKGNPHRDPTVQPMFELIDIAASTKSTLTKVDVLRKALNLSGNMDEKDARIVMASLNQKKYTEPSELMAAMSEFAKNKPEVFLAAYDDPQKENKAIMKSAMDEGILVHNIVTGQITMDKVNIAVATISDDVLSVLVSWVKTADNGKEVFELIKKKIKDKTSKKELAPA